MYCAAALCTPQTPQIILVHPWTWFSFSWSDNSTNKKIKCFMFIMHVIIDRSLPGLMLLRKAAQIEDHSSIFCKMGKSPKHLRMNSGFLRTSDHYLVCAHPSVCDGNLCWRTVTDDASMIRCSPPPILVFGKSFLWLQFRHVLSYFLLLTLLAMWVLHRAISLSQHVCMLTWAQWAICP